MTSHIQPDDAGIIRCFKAHYWRAFAERAIVLDNAGERDIWKINLLEAMRMAERAWDEVSSEIIQNCWRHTGIVPEHPAIDIDADTTPHSDTGSTLSSSTTAAQVTAWAVMRRYALSSTMTHPQAENTVKAALGAAYWEEEWEGVLSAVLDAENNTSAALKAIEEAERTSRSPQPGTSTPRTSLPTTPSPVMPALADDAHS
jgi:hypothetical protein